jgi:hypothetical protein
MLEFADHPQKQAKTEKSSLKIGHFSPLKSIIKWCLLGQLTRADAECATGLVAVQLLQVGSLVLLCYLDPISTTR